MSDELIKIAGSGIIYRNPAAHVSSRHAYFPSLACQAEGTLVASFVIGEAFEAVNADTHVSLSQDGGQTWTEPHPILPAEYKYLFSNCARITSYKGELVAMIVRSDRAAHPGQGLANPANMGFVPTDLLIARSGDNGETWTKPATITSPLTGPSFEACSPIVVLTDGRWLWPTSTWRGWDGDCPNGMKMVALVSHDKGKTWPEFMDVMDRHEENIIFWESKIVELPDSRLLAAAWTYDETKGRDLPIHFTISQDSGKTWLPPAPTGIIGQTIVLITCDNGKILSVYRRMDQPGLWATLSRLEENDWVNETNACLWGGQNSDLTQKPANMVQEFNDLKFGAPAIIRLQDNSLLTAFWCYENLVSNIRWFKLTINATKIIS